MSYRVVIPTAGLGSRLKELTRYINKSLVSVANRPILSHLIEQFPSNCEFVIALGYKGNLVRDFLELTYPHKTFFFVNVDPYEGVGSGLGFTLKACKQYLQQPFVFISCDTLVKGFIPNPDHDWMGFTQKDNLEEYRTVKISQGIVSEICEKGVFRENLSAYIGLAGIFNYENFWQAMNLGAEVSIEQGEAYGMKSLLTHTEIRGYDFKWFDTGNVESMTIAREAYTEANQPNILEKQNEAIWFIDNAVIKYSDDINFIANRVNRAEELFGFVPSIEAYRANMYRYEKIDGDVLSKVVTPLIFEDFLEKCKGFWIEKKLTTAEQKKFQRSCMDFYKDKTFERIQLFYKNFNQADNAQIINGEQMPKLQDLLNEIDWNWMSMGLAGRFHGDFHFENIIWSKENKKFTFLDWRQDFAGDLSVGDIYYDLAKLMHGLIVNHGIVASGQFSASWTGGEIIYNLSRKENLIECEKRLCGWMQHNNYDVKKVKVLTALIYLNIAALHHYPYSLLLYGLGTKMLKYETVGLEKNIT
ncbi:phosphotransferase [Alphaproteobacteria bacterium]|nr:phosphotransferase [Alphaproteobacteria bacterium]